jgi:ribosomal protein S18 acetylase RimI-like enzyme
LATLATQSSAEICATKCISTAELFWKSGDLIQEPNIPTQSPRVSVRGASAADIPGILECLSAAFEPYRDSYTPGAFLDTVLTPETLNERLVHMQVFVALSPDGQIAGTIACNLIGPKEGHIRGMAVLPALQGNGLATQLLDHAQWELRRVGCARITLDTTEPLRRAIRFYEEHGFRRSGKITDFFGMPLIEYHKTLNSRAPSPVTTLSGT